MDAVNPPGRSGSPYRALAYLRRLPGEDDAARVARITDLGSQVQRRGWDLVATHTDDSPGLDERPPGLAAALLTLREGGADVLVVPAVDCVGESVLGLGEVIDRAAEQGWGLLVVDLGIEVSPSVAVTLSRVLRVVAGWDGGRNRLLAAAEPTACRRQWSTPDEVCERIAGLREHGTSYPQIARILDEDGVPTTHGAPSWTGGTVSEVLKRYHRRQAGRASDGSVPDGASIVPPPEGTIVVTIEVSPGPFRVTVTDPATGAP